MCCLTVIHHSQQLPTPTPLVTVARWRSCPPCRTFCLGWPNPIAPLKSFCFAARNSLPVWRKVPNNMTYVTPPPPLHPHSIPPTHHLRPGSVPGHRLDSAAAVNNALPPVTITRASPGQSFCDWLDPGREIERLRHIFGSEQGWSELLLLLAARPSSGHSKGRAAAEPQTYGWGKSHKTKGQSGSS